MIKVKVSSKGNKSVALFNAISEWKQKVFNAKQTQELKDRAHYEKPSRRKKAMLDKAKYQLKYRREHGTDNN